MKTTWWTLVLVLVLAWIAVGCTAAPSLHGFDKSFAPVQDAEIEGTWVVEDEDVEFTVTGGKGKTYDVLATYRGEEEAVQVRLTATLAKVGEQNLVDLQLAKEERKLLEDRYFLLVIPTHVFLRPLPPQDGVVRVVTLDPKWVASWPGVATIEEDDAPLLTHDQETLRHVLEAAARDEDAWVKGFEIRRQ